MIVCFACLIDSLLQDDVSQAYQNNNVTYHDKYVVILVDEIR
jgi:hypothetical protein